LLDASGADLAPGGGALNLLDRIDLSGLDARIKECGSTWPAMSTTRWSARKARRPFSVRRKGRRRRWWRGWTTICATMRTSSRDLHYDVAEVPGAGAGGGIGAAMLVFLGGRLRPGSEIVTDAVGLDAR
jgi:glycerate kinase